MPSAARSSDELRAQKRRARCARALATKSAGSGGGGGGDGFTRRLAILLVKSGTRAPSRTPSKNAPRANNAENARAIRIRTQPRLLRNNLSAEAPERGGALSTRNSTARRD